jgi:hypothetical protein
LPSPITVLYELSRLPDDAFDQAMADGKIHPGTTHKDAAALVHQSKVQLILNKIENDIEELIEVAADQIDDDCRKFARHLSDELFTWAEHGRPKNEEMEATAKL